MICWNCKERDTTKEHVRACCAGQTVQAAVKGVISKALTGGTPVISKALTGGTPVTVEPATLADAPVEGFYERDGHYYKVVQSENTGQFYAYEGEPQPGQKIEWVYEGRRPLHHLTAANRLTAEQAADLGKLTERCVFCSRKLTDGRSTDVGYGPDCAAREGLPWGEKETA